MKKKGYIFREGKQVYAYLGEALNLIGNFSILIILPLYEDELDVSSTVLLIIGYFFVSWLIPIFLFKSIQCNVCKNQYIFHHMGRRLNFEVKQYGYNPFEDDFCDQCNPEKQLLN